jgi:hypothetical protein
MPKHDDRENRSLPVTAEVGGEGGSFADPTVQVATTEGDLARGRGHGGAASAATQATRRADVPPAGPGAVPEIVRYPSEPPSSETSTASRVVRFDWRTALAGVAVGAALAMVVSKLRSTQHP